MEEFATWLYQTSLSTTIRDISWLIPAVQSVHIVAIAVILGSALVMDLRLAGVLAADEPARTVVQRYLPWTWGALIVLLVTGLGMSIGEPDRVLVNSVFWLKMALVVTVFALTWALHRPFVDATREAGPDWADFLVKGAAWLSLFLWVCVIVCGRWIAYVTT